MGKKRRNKAKADEASSLDGSSVGDGVVIEGRHGNRIGPHYWPHERLFFLINESGQVSKKNGQALVYSSSEDASANRRAGQWVGGATILRLTPL